MKNKFSFFVIILCFFSTAWSQPPLTDGYRGKNDEFPPFILAGRVIDISDAGLSLLTREGERLELSLSERTLFTIEVAVDRSEVKKGDRLLLIGPSTEEVFEIRVLSDNEDRAAESAVHPSPPKTAAALKIPMLIAGKVTGLNPLTIRLSSGDERPIIITGKTRLIRERPDISFKDRKGHNVLVVAPIIPGEGRKAEKVIFYSENDSPAQDKSNSYPFGPQKEVFGPNRHVNFNNSPGISNKVLLPDLHQQPENPEFIYGLWLGRGLYSNRELERAFKTAKNLGIRYFKVEFKWGYVEPENNKWKWNDEKMLDVEKIISLAKEHNISIIPYFDTFMPWGEKKFPDPSRGECIGAINRWGQSQSPDAREYAEYVFTVLDKLIKGGVVVRYIELDNEISNLNDGYKSLNCFINITAKQIKEIENAAYEKVKAKYPNIMISSTTFSFPGIGTLPFGETENAAEKDKKTRNSFIKAYFEDAPKPKFDFLGLHETVSGSGNPYTIWHKHQSADYEYNFGSYHDAYKIWRNILDRYGYGDKPILNLESPAILTGKQSAEIIQKVVFARANAGSSRLVGIIISQLTGSKKFTEGMPEEAITVGLARFQDGMELNDGYYGLYNVLNILSNYPVYEGKIAGEIGRQKPWVERFGSKGSGKLYVAFIPYRLGLIRYQDLTLRIGAEKEAKVTKQDATVRTIRSNNDGFISVAVDDRPLFIEVSE